MAQVEFEVPGPGTYLIDADPSLPALSNPGQASDVLSGEQFYDEDGNPVTGTMPNNPAEAIVIPGGGSYNIPQGYHTGHGTVTSSGSALPTLTNPASAGEIASGKEVIDQNGAVMTGTMPSNPAISETLEAGESYQVPAGYTPGGTVQAASLASQTPGTATQDDIIQGQTAWVNGVQVTGALEPGSDTSDATATAADILEGETAYVATGKVSGTMPNNGAVQETLQASGQYTIPAGYHNGQGTVTAETLANQTQGTATAPDILDGKTAWVNGAQVTGSMPDNGAVTKEMTAGETYNIPAGYHNGSGTVTAPTVASETPGTAVAGDIRQGKTAWVAGEQLTGTVPDIEAATPTISVSPAGLITAETQQGAGYVAQTTKAASQQLQTQGAQTITPGTTAQTIQANVYLTGAQTIQGDTNLVPDNIKENVSIFGVTGSFAGGGSTGDFAVPLVVNTENGATVTAVNGETSLTAIATNGKARFVLNSSGNWEITAFSGDRIAYTTVSVSPSYIATINLPSDAIYGVEWDGSSNPSWTRTDAAAGFPDPEPAVNNGTGSSPFDGILPWSGLEVVEDEDAGTLVRIPKYYYKWTRTGASMKLQITAVPYAGFLISPAHADRGDGMGERNYVYVARYHCAPGYKSQAGTQPVQVTRAAARIGIHTLGTDVWQYDFAMYWTIMMLYLVEFANWNSQAVIGYGCSENNQLFDMGLTDSMQYHTGTSAATRETYGCCQYRHIEGLWDNGSDWVDGIYFSGANIYCIKSPKNFNDTSGGILVGQRDPDMYGNISAWTNPTESGFEYALYPNASSGRTYATYVCDGSSNSQSGTLLYAGGSYGKSTFFGAFFLSGNFTASSNSGCRIQKLP